MNDTIKAVQELASGIIAEWVASASELAELVISWTINTWEAKCDDILDDENQELVKSMLENTDFTRCGRGATVLNDWRVLLRTIHGDGCGGVYTSEECKCWQTAVRNASAYCEMTAALHEILNIIPAIVNRHQQDSPRESAQRSLGEPSQHGGSGTVGREAPGEALARNGRGGGRRGRAQRKANEGGVGGLNGAVGASVRFAGALESAE